MVTDERRILSALDLSPAEGEPVAYLRDLQPGAEDEALAVCWSGDPGAFPVYATPSNPVVSDEMVQAVATLYGNYIPGHGWTGFGPTPEQIAAALSVKPQSGGDTP